MTVAASNIPDDVRLAFNELRWALFEQGLGVGAATREAARRLSLGQLEVFVLTEKHPTMH